MADTPHEDFQYGPLKENDSALLAQLLMQERISVAGRVDLALYRAFIRDALAGRGPHIMVVQACGSIVGWSIGVVDSRRYWTSFLARHPAAGIKILIGLFLRKYGQHKEARRELTVAEKCRIDPGTPPSANCDNWGKGGRRTARLIDTTVLPLFRGTGLGGRLQYHHLKELRKLGILRAEAYVRAEKTGWLLFNARSGFKVAAKIGHSYLIINDLGESPGDGD
jgi:hypothetical protein